MRQPCLHLLHRFERRRSSFLHDGDPIRLWNGGKRRQPFAPQIGGRRLELAERIDVMLVVHEVPPRRGPSSGLSRLSFSRSRSLTRKVSSFAGVRGWLFMRASFLSNHVWSSRFPCTRSKRAISRLTLLPRPDGGVSSKMARPYSSSSEPISIERPKHADHVFVRRVPDRDRHGDEIAAVGPEKPARNVGLLDRRRFSPDRGIVPSQAIKVSRNAYDLPTVRTFDPGS